jgi:hypothetical protein
MFWQLWSILLFGFVVLLVKHHCVFNLDTDSLCFLEQKPRAIQLPASRLVLKAKPFSCPIIKAIALRTDSLSCPVLL